MKHVDKTFSGEEIDIDFQHFINCAFKSCTLVFHAVGPVGMQGCTFDGGTKWRFEDSAATTIKFLAAIRSHGPGAIQLTDEVIATIQGSGGMQTPR